MLKHVFFLERLLSHFGGYITVKDTINMSNYYLNGIYEPLHEKTKNVVFNRSDTNRNVQSQK